MTKPSKAVNPQEERELKEIIETMVREIKTELGTKAGLNEIEAVLLKRQSEIMSKVMEHLAKDQDFSPSGDTK
jgi:hypothetical protein